MKIDVILNYLRDVYPQFHYYGRTDINIWGTAGLNEIDDHRICWISGRKNAASEVIRRLRSCRDAVAVCPFPIDHVNCIVTDYPKGVFFELQNHFFAPGFLHEISPKATVLTEKLGENVHIGPNCYIGPDASIGDNTIIYPNVTIISPCRIGHDCVIFPGVVIGSDGFGYYDKDGAPNREIHLKGVDIGNYVDIGANTCIDRGLLTDTVVSDYVKIDNLCQIGHNAVIGKGCLVIAQTVVCGSALVGAGSYLAPGSIIMNQVKVGKRVKIGINSAVMGDIDDDTAAFGTPAVAFMRNKKS